MHAARSLPQGAGIGFKPEHLHALLASPGAVDFVEVHAENYMGAGGPAHAQLAAVRAVTPLSVHGVGLSLGGATPIDRIHLARLRAVADRYEAAAVSEHLAWSTHAGCYFGDLLPLAYDDASLQRTVAHVSQAQEGLGRRLSIENPSTYLPLAGSVMDEVDFLRELSARSGCALLLDINNAVVSCRNHGADPADYLARFPLERVAQIHLAGHARVALDDGTELRIDDHGSAVDDETWALFADVVARTGALPTLIEWDTDVPGFDTLAAEAALARRALLRANARVAA
jgi:uncharacterized protein (UPF0276 family)